MYEGQEREDPEDGGVEGVAAFCAEEEVALDGFHRWLISAGAKDDHGAADVVEGQDRTEPM